MSARYYSFFYDEDRDVTADVYSDLRKCIEERDKFVSSWQGWFEWVVFWRIAILDWKWKIVWRFLTDEEIVAEAKAISEFLPKKDAYMDKFVPINLPFLYGKISKEERDDRIKAEAGPYPEGTYFSDMPIEQFVILSEKRHVADDYVPKEGERIYTLLDGGDYTYYQVGRAYVEVLGKYAWKDLGYPDRTVIW